jgi:hypothetical protein
MEALGNALHAVEDYYSHSNFVEVCLYFLMRDGSITPTEYRSLALTELGRETAWIGTPGGATRPAIITGTYATKWDSVVSIVEVLHTKLEGVMAKAERLIGNVTGAMTGITGAVGGGVIGALAGAAEGWRTHSGLSALGHTITGFFSGARSGLLSGAAGGYATGLSGGAALVRGIISPALTMLDELAGMATALAAREAATRGLGPTHSEIAKDAPTHRLFGISRMLAVMADQEIGAAIQTAWSTVGTTGAGTGTTPVPATVISSVTDLVDKYVCYPVDDPAAWWRAPLIAAVKGRGP